MNPSEISRQIDRGAIQVIRTLKEAGFETYLVGGAVRDVLVGVKPKDFDISTSATPEQVRDIFGRRKARIIGKRFKIVHVYEYGVMFEVSTFRRTPSDKERCARPSDDGSIVWRDNVWGTPEEDANRRDFTANALYMDTADDFKIIDFCGGIEDIKNKVVRSLGDPRVRFTEDPVRMLRAAKLKAQYGFEFEDNVGSAIKELAEKITLVSQRRLYEEILKITYKPYLAETLRVCYEYGLLRYIIPSIHEILDSEDAAMYLSVLAARDAFVARGGTVSRAFSLSLMAYRHVEKIMDSKSKFGDYWEYYEGMERDVRRAVDSFMRPHNMTRIISSRVRDVIMMQGRILSGKSLNKIKRHPEFFYASIVYKMQAPLLGWDEVPELPEPRTRRPESRPRSEGRPRKSRRPRRKPRQDT